MKSTSYKLRTKLIYKIKQKKKNNLLDMMRYSVFIYTVDIFNEIFYTALNNIKIPTHRMEEQTKYFKCVENQNFERT